MISSKKKLIVITALSVTVLFTLPRLAALGYMARNTGHQPDAIDFIVRVLYTFGTAIVFLCLNLRPHRIAFRYFTINMGNAFHAGAINLLLAFSINTAFLYLHRQFFDPAVDPRLFRFFFNIRFYLEVALVIALAHIYRLLLFNHQIKLANEHLQTVNAETRYQALVSQMDPHYLFNSLNTVTALIRQDSQKAIQYVTDMSQTMRYTLESGKQVLISLAQELEFVHAYTNILNSRYGDKLRINVLIENADKQLLLPPMALQLLIENALNHNAITRDKPLFIDISVHNGELTVSNTLRPKNRPVNSTGIGLSNLNERCRHLYKKEIIIRKTEDFFTVLIPLANRHEYTDH